MNMNFEELQEQGWSDFQQVDGRWWGFPPGAVMPVPVGRPENLLAELRSGVGSYAELRNLRGGSLLPPRWGRLRPDVVVERRESFEQRHLLRGYDSSGIWVDKQVPFSCSYSDINRMRSPVYGDGRLPVTTELTEAELKINAAIKKSLGTVLPTAEAGAARLGAATVGQ
jgi:hypothetical protein